MRAPGGLPTPSLKNFQSQQTKPAFRALSTTNGTGNMPCALIPHAVEAVPNLQYSRLHMPEHCVSLQRPLTPLVALPALTRLEFTCECRTNLYIDWTPQALKLIGQALLEIKKSCRKVKMLF